MAFKAFLISIPTSNQQGILAVEQYFNPTRYFTSTEINHFWLSNFGPNFYVNRDLFFTALEKFIGYRITGRERDIISSTLDSSDSNLICVPIFCDFVKVYSVSILTIKAAVENLLATSRHSWFAGNIFYQLIISYILLKYVYPILSDSISLFLTISLMSE